MLHNKIKQFKRVSIITFIVFIMLTGSVFAESTLLKEGMENSIIVQLQNKLKILKYFNTDSTGYYGSITEEAVKKFQKDNDLNTDGIVGGNTIQLLDSILSNETKVLQTQLKNLNFFSYDATGYYGPLTTQAVINFQKANGLIADGVAGPNTKAAIANAFSSKRTKVSQVSRSGVSKDDLLVPWFNGAENIFKRNDVATVTDVDTGTTFKVKRLVGTNHADVETLTLEDTKKLKSLYGGEFSWERRAVLIETNDRVMAASLAGMPHAGREDKPYLETVSGRSGGYGTGTNLDGVKGNGMSGVIDLHFYNSRTHGTNRVDSKHQAMILKAAKSR